jgi:hypothetical protein
MLLQIADDRDGAEALVQVEAAPLESQLLRPGEQASEHSQLRIAGKDKSDG